MEDITTEAGTAKGNFYRYFPTWDDLLVAVRDHLLDSYADDLARRYSDLAAIDWWVAVDEEMERFIELQVSLGGLHDAVFHGPAAAARPIEQHRSARAMLARFLLAGIDGGAFAEVDVEPTATLLFEVLHGAFDAIVSGMDRLRVMDATRHVVHRTLRPDPLDEQVRQGGVDQ